VKKQSVGMTVRLTSDEHALLEVMDYSFSEVVHQFLDNLAMINQHDDIKEVLQKFDARQRQERESFKATLEMHYKNQVVGGIRYSKRQKAIREIHTALESVLGSPPWDSIAYRERIRDYHLGTLADVKISQEELEGYSKIRGFLVSNKSDTAEYLPTFAESTIDDDAPIKTRKKARESLERQLRSIIKSTSKDEIDDVLQNLLSNPSWNSMADKADVELKDVFTRMIAPGTGVIFDD